MVRKAKWFAGGGGSMTENREKMEAAEVMAYRSGEGAMCGEEAHGTIFL
jgi:hypothetical protein